MRSKYPKGTGGAFTLIELLIVVAIIAILAAIAVPNFLEAQVRSKVSRVKADMRSVATAIESYVVDYNKPPVGTEEFTVLKQEFGVRPIVSNNAADKWGWIYAQITSPIAYITTPPTDPFLVLSQRFKDGELTSIENIDRPELRYYNYDSYRPGVIEGTTRVAMPRAFRPSIAKGVAWSLDSVGPSQARNVDLGGGVYRTAHPSIIAGQLTIDDMNAYSVNTSVYMEYPLGIYDATNGTRSFGFIVRSNWGIGE